MKDIGTFWMNGAGNCYKIVKCELHKGRYIIHVNYPDLPLDFPCSIDQTYSDVQISEDEYLLRSIK